MVLKSLLLLFVLTACGSEAPSGATESLIATPTAVTRIIPPTAKAGDTVSVRGSGFSVVAGENIIWFGSSPVVASAYAPLASAQGSEIEEVQGAVPTTLAAGSYEVRIQVGEMFSNADKTLTVTP